MLEKLKDFFSFILPQPNYTLLNTFFYALGFIAGSYLFFSFLKIMKIKVDKNLAISFFPFVLLGSCLRVLVDLSIMKSVFLVTPLIYLTIGSFLALTIFFSKIVEKRFSIPYFKLTYRFGMLLVAPAITIFLLNIKTLLPLPLVFIFFSPWIFLMKICKWKKENKAVFLFQAFDATVSFVGINFFGYEEMHVLPRFLIKIFGPISFIFFKTLITFLILFLTDKARGKKEVKDYVKLLIAILGASTGTRDLFRMLASV